MRSLHTHTNKQNDSWCHMTFLSLIANPTWNAHSKLWIFSTETHRTNKRADNFMWILTQANITWEECCKCSIAGLLRSCSRKGNDGLFSASIQLPNFSQRRQQHRSIKKGNPGEGAVGSHISIKLPNSLTREATAEKNPKRKRQKNRKNKN